MTLTPKPRQGDILHNALEFLGTALLDRAFTQKDTEELGCLLLILADYSYLASRADDE